MRLIYVIFLSYLFATFANANETSEEQKVIFKYNCQPGIEALINSKDKSSFKKLRKLKISKITAFDGRHNKYVEFQAFRYRAVYDNGHNIIFRINLEYATKNRQIAEFYAHMMGQIPNFLRRYVRTVTIHKGFAGWYGGSNNMTIHPEGFAGSACEEEIMIHETGHITLDNAGGKQINDKEWKKAQKADGIFISNYAKNNPDREDIAETVMAWLAVRCKPERMSKEEYNKIINGIPNRLKVLDKAYKDYYPMKCKAKK